MTVLGVFDGGSTTGFFSGTDDTLSVRSPINNPQGNFIYVVVYNYSAYLVQVNIGSSQNWLEPATANSFPAPRSGSSIDLTAESVPNVAADNTGTVQAVWYTADDGVPVGFPLALPSSSLIADQGAVNILSLALGGSMFGPVLTDPVPPGAVALMVVLVFDEPGPAPALADLHVSGTTTGAEYLTLGELLVTFPKFAPYNSVADPVLELSGTPDLGGGQLEMYAIFSPISEMSTMAKVNAADSVPGWGTLIGGNYGDPSNDPGEFIAVQVDPKGRIIPRVPTSAASATATGQILAAPVSGAHYLDGVDYVDGTALVTGAVIVDAGGVQIAGLGIGGDGASTVDLHGFRTTVAVNVTFTSSSSSKLVILRYSTGP